jgi:alanine dehydrogenase
MSLGVIPETERAEVVIIGGGVVGSRSALTAAGLGSKVTVLQKKDKRIRINFLKKYFKQELSVLSKNIRILESNPKTIAAAVKKADLLIGSVLVKGAKAPRIVTKKMVESMNKGAVIVDVSIDQGGCIWGSKPTSHSEPIYLLKDKIYCCITNMPGQVSRQSTQALTSATLPYLLKMANKGVENAFKSDKGLKKGLNTYKGKITYKAVAHDLGMMNHYEELK